MLHSLTIWRCFIDILISCKKAKFLDVRYSLATARHYLDSSRLKRLFNAILDIHNAGWREYVLQVVKEKRRGEPHAELSTVYSDILEEEP